MYRKNNQQGNANGVRLIASAAAGVLAVVGFIAADLTPALAENLAEREDEVVARKSKVVNGKSFTFEKRLVDGEVQGVVRDDRGVEIAESAVPRAKKSIVSAKLETRLAEMQASGDFTGKVLVNIALELPEVVVAEEPEAGEAEIVRGELKQAKVNGLEMSPAELDSRASTKATRLSEVSAARQKQIKGHLGRWVKTHGVKMSAAIGEAVKHSKSTVTVALTAEELEQVLQANDGLIAGVELHEPAEDDITQAMNATSITSSALPYSTTRGAGIGVYMTESGCANESRISNYDRLSGSETNHSRNVGAIIRAVSPASRLYCRGGAVLPTTIDLHAATFNALLGWNIYPVLSPRIEIVTRSNSSNDSTSYNTDDRDWDNFVYNERIVTFNSGGNTGNGTGNVRSPGKGLNIITVGNYNDANSTIVGSSPFVDPRTKNDKPEVVAPGASINAGGFTMTGTSQATPHAAAFAADMMSSSTYLKRRPYLTKAKLLAGATDSISGGSDKVGLGGIDFASAHWSGRASWWEGNNSSFTDFARNDGGTSNTYIEKKVYISSSWNKARIVLAWLNRGSYTYSHRNDAHPIGMDLDMRVYDPHGNYKGGSFSWDNPYEKVEFSPTVSGYYTIKINRYANRDSSLNLRMGLYTNYFT